MDYLCIGNNNIVASIWQEVKFDWLGGIDWCQFV